MFVILGALVLAGFGWGLHHVTKKSLTRVLAGGLQAVLRAETAALERWLENEALDTKASAARIPIRKNAQELVQTLEGFRASVDSLLESPALTALREDLQADLMDHDVRGFAVIDRNGLVLAADTDSLIGSRLEAGELPGLKDVFEGKATPHTSPRGRPVAPDGGPGANPRSRVHLASGIHSGNRWAERDYRRAGVPD
ncbi:MAG: hypothetical protein ACYTFO_03515 [Planctomycetota bacterium]